ncbi:MAG: phosphatidylinositol mannoside acyltransferase [Actinomycetota bacterium]|nr:phosphatidylinositol mannoside acyltransferase [Actinomycetota bacterium]
MVSDAGGARTAWPWCPRYGSASQLLTYVVYRAAGTALQRMPEPAGAAVAFAASQVLAVHDAAERQMYLRHLEKVLGRPLGRDEARQWARRVFASYARYWHEGARLPTVPGTVIDERFEVESGLHHLREAVGRGRGVVMALPHLGSWEWGGAWMARHGMPVTAVAEVLRPPALFEWFVHQRRAMGLDVVPLGAGASGPLLRVLKAGGLVGLVADRDLSGAGVPVQFFGETTTLPAGPATLALRSGAALLPVAIYQGPGPSHRALVLPPVDLARTASLRADVGRVTQALAGVFEILVRRAPDQWYCFQPMWPSDQVALAGVGADEALADRCAAPRHTQ